MIRPTLTKARPLALRALVIAQSLSLAMPACTRLQSPPSVDSRADATATQPSELKTTAASLSSSSPASSEGWRELEFSDLHTTHGSLVPAATRTGWLTADATTRAVTTFEGADGAEVDFLYRGAMTNEGRLSSGEWRSQIGVKLRAADGCNLIYAMWRIAPRSGIVVQMKRNPGQHTNEECETRGYTTLRPRESQPPLPIADDHATRHTLRAEIIGRELEVAADGRVVWRGTLPAEADELHGPVGVRTDAGRFEFSLRVPPLKR